MAEGKLGCLVPFKIQSFTDVPGLVFSNRSSLRASSCPRDLHFSVLLMVPPVTLSVEGLWRAGSTASTVPTEVPGAQHIGCQMAVATVMKGWLLKTGTALRPG